MNLGAGGFRYSHRLGGSARDPRLVHPSSSHSDPPLPVPGQSFEVVEPGGLVDAGADQLLDEIRAKSRASALLPWVVAASVLGFVASLVLFQADRPGAAAWAMLACGVLGLVSLPWAVGRDREARTVRVHYLFDPLGSGVQAAVDRFIGALVPPRTVWTVGRSLGRGDWKRNVVEGTSITRRAIRAGWGGPSFIETNAKVGALEAADDRLYFFPDRVLIFGRSGVHSAHYADLSAQAGNVQFRENGSIPRDAEVVGKTWRHATTGGGPDGRFKNNYQIPIVLYGSLEISSPAGLRLCLLTSSEAAAVEAEAHLREIATCVQNLASRGSAAPRIESLDEFPQKRPFQGFSAARAIERLADLATFRWFDGLPEWASPIAWGLLLALSPAALVVWLVNKDAGAGLFFCVSLALAGCGAGRLLYESLRGRRGDRLKSEPASSSRFRAVLANELRVRPLEAVKFSELVAASAVSRRNADRIADELLRKVVAKSLAVRTFTEEDRAKLQTLARALEIDAGRARRLEGEAKAERYRQAVAEVAADGAVTAEEARMLNELRGRFGISGADWTPGNLKPPG